MVAKWLIREREIEQAQEKVRKRIDAVLTGRKGLTTEQIIRKMRAEWKNY